MAEQLKPCPFCGGDKVHLIGYDAAIGRKTAPECWVACGTCGATSNTSSFPENAVAKWNRRPEAAQVRVKALTWSTLGADPACIAQQFPYQIWPHNGGSGAPDDPFIKFNNFRVFEPFMMNCVGDEYETLDEAKAAAQADYDRRIRAALEPVDEGDLDERMKAAGMIPLSELLESHGPMEKFKQHAAVKTFDDFVWWIKSQQKKFMTMRMRYELGDEDKGDDLFEWVFAHAAVYDQIATQLRALEQPNTLAQPDGWRDISTAPKAKSQPVDLWVVHEGKGLRITNVIHWDCYVGATHWRPLPPAPEKEG